MHTAVYYIARCKPTWIATNNMKAAGILHAAAKWHENNAVLIQACNCLSCRIGNALVQFKSFSVMVNTAQLPLHTDSGKAGNLARASKAFAQTRSAPLRHQVLCLTRLAGIQTLNGQP